MSEIQPYELKREGTTPLERARIGDWYWVTFEDKEWDEKAQKRVKTGTHEDLMCISHIGSNHFVMSEADEHGNSTCRIHFRDFENECREELNWKQHIESKMARLQIEMKEAMRKMIEEGKSLALIPEEVVHAAPQSSETTLPAIATKSPKQHQTELVEFQKRMPEIQKEVGQLAKEFAITAKNLALPDLIQLGKVQKALGVVNDRIFNLELYCGLQEEVHQIAEGEPAPMETQVSIMQQLLYMDEECLFDYDDGGMDFSKLSQFDEWVVRPENLNRLAPHQRCIVGFRVRRHTKERERVRTISQAWVRIAEEAADMETYLLIRNGENVYRIASPVNFSPRLVPKRNEIGEAQFLKVHRHYDFKKHKDNIKEEKIGPDHLDYDKHVEDLDNAIKHYNRIIILLQGMFDRTAMFMPHVGVKLTEDGHMDKWVRCVRDEEDGLPNNKVTWEGYRDQMNSSIKRGKRVWSKWYPDTYGHRNWGCESTSYTTPEEEVMRRPRVCEVTAIRRDRSEVRVSFDVTRTIWGRGYYDRTYDKEMTRGVWVPMEEVFNITDYNLGDYKMFLCDRALQGDYLKWAEQLLTAEDEARKALGRDTTAKPDSDGYVRRMGVDHNGNSYAYREKVQEEDDE